ncbi:MAG: three-Cys-motif partner protein TcmP, partial [Anaerolineaceae bacterium]|nr:three-Cys-motif partner protein TcmP [Anaerolineaceae bacterium]
MSKSNKEFFKEKKIWSEIKDRLLGWYLTPYLSKILWTKRSVNYIDCFAGKGKFGDGNPGSPIIALDSIKNTLLRTKTENIQINSYFIDSNYSNELEKNLSSYTTTKIINGRFEEEIISLLEDKQDQNIFLYIDP